MVVLINTGSGILSTTLSWGSIGLPAAERMAVRDLWAKKNLGTVAGSFAVTVGTAHDNSMLKLCPVAADDHNSHPK